MSGGRLADIRGPRMPLLRTVNYIFLVVAILVIVLPMVIIFIISFKGDKEYMYSSFYTLPRSFLNFENYKVVVDKGLLLLGLKNTALLSLVSVTGSVVMGTMVAYALGRFDFKLKKLVLNAFLLSAMVPGITTQVATFTIIKNLGLFNTIYAGMVLYIATDVLQIYVFLQFVRRIPYEIDESALLDGASFFRIYRSIIIPQMKPAIATVAIIKLLFIYNDMFTPYLYMPKSSLRTVTTAIMLFSYDRNSQWNVMAAGILAVMIPTLVLYLFAQRSIISGISAGAVKG
jgi:raffinose/stachyose/melibiose transport system permease protein